MNDARSFPTKTVLVATCVVLILVATLYAVVKSSALVRVSHQPTTLLQMRLLVTPADPAIITALAEALAVSATITKNQSGTVAAFDCIRGWVSSNIEYVSDDKSHGVADYWQTPSETIGLGTGDCEDLAILLVSLLRAYGAPDDHVFVAVGSDLNDNWHAYVIERYYIGIWRVLDAEYARNASFVDSIAGESYRTSYCFNDRRSFNGLPVYPENYVVPEIPVTTGVSPINKTIFLGIPNTDSVEAGARLRDPSFDEVKRSLGKLWLPSYLPSGYNLSDSWLLGNAGVDFVYQKIFSSDLEIVEYRNGGEMEFPENTVKEVMVKGDVAYLVKGGRTMQGAPPNRTFVWNHNQELTLYFSLDGRIITVRGFWADSWTEEELIKIAESLTPY